MLCPFCLTVGSIEQAKPEHGSGAGYRCKHCAEQIPALYVQGYRQYPPVVVSAVGFRAHGKTVYFGSLFYALKKLKLGKHWKEFFTMGLNEESLDTVRDNVGMLEQGRLPDANPKNFPRPTIVRVSGVPFQHDATLLFYDTGGECFERPTQLIQYAQFVKQARTAMFLVSVSNMDDPTLEMQRLLETYVSGMGELGGRTQDQHLVVVFTKADQMHQRLAGWDGLAGYLRQGSVDGLARPESYMPRLRRISSDLRQFARNELGAYEFENAARKSFRSVHYTMVSALGAQPSGDQLSVEITPRRVLDPLMFLMEKSLPPWRQAARRLLWSTLV